MLKKSYIPLFLLGMCALINLYSTQPILGQLGAWAHIAPERAAWTVSATTLGVAICAPFSGAISDVYGRKKVMLCALGIMVISTIACCFLPIFLCCWCLDSLRGSQPPLYLPSR
ncbi:MFS transporter [Corynebacterium sp. ACRQM]|uniref:MFS transporter n=1 Tax=Corynebacterium sp. ACRQM TaxID=2918193 RepID=UPI00351D420B